MTLEERFLIDMDNDIYNNKELKEYHIRHIRLVRSYAKLINKRLGSCLDNRKLGYISLAHDILKESGLDPEGGVKIIRGYNVPQDVIRYVRTNLDILEKFDLDEYFNSSCQYHALAAGIFVYKEFGIHDPEIIYPMFFHSCQIMDIYLKLPNKIQTMIDIIMLSDKLSSNYLRINYKESKVKCDLDATVFGLNGNEFNYSLGLVMARLISAGNSKEKESDRATEYYINRMKRTCPLSLDVKNWGEQKIWPKRKSQAFRIL